MGVIIKQMVFYRSVCGISLFLIYLNKQVSPFQGSFLSGAFFKSRISPGAMIMTPLQGGFTCCSCYYISYEGF